jgi:hypothetical protein
MSLFFHIKRSGSSYLVQFFPMPIFKLAMDISEFLNHKNFPKIIEFLDIIHRPIFYLKHNVSETGFSLRLQAKANSVRTNR